MFWEQMTQAGDAAFLLPLAACGLLWLVAGRAWAWALLWCTSVLAAVTLVLITKIMFVSWNLGDSISTTRFVGISGHATLSSLIIPGLVYLSLLGAPRLERAAGLLAGVALAILIGISRFRMIAHSPVEIIGGLLTGSLLLGLLLYRAKRLPLPRLHTFWLLLLSLPVGLHYYGDNANLEEALFPVVRQLRLLQGDFKPSMQLAPISVPAGRNTTDL